MKQNIYLFSDSILRRKDNTLLFETSPLKEPSHSADIAADEIENLIAPEPSGNGTAKKFIPAENVDAIYTFGPVKFNSLFLNFISKHFIPVHVFNYYGGYVGSFFPKAEINSGNILINQVCHYIDNTKRLGIAKKFVYGAGLNAISNLKYYSYRGVDLDEDINKLDSLVNSIDNVSSVGELFGIEGNIKSSYYSSWKKFFRQDVDFSKRVQRPPDNVINSLISFGNVVLYGIVLTEIYRTGLIPSIGYLHSPGDNRFPLSFDIAEIFKPVIIDKTIFRVINLEIINENGFTNKAGLMYMKEDTKRAYIEAIEDRLKTTFVYDELKRSITYKTLIRIECHNLIKHLKGSGFYKPYINS